jgi:hypothetical protein
MSSFPIWTSAIRYVSGSEMSIPSKDKARARLPKRVPGKGQKFTLTMVNPLELRGEIAIESSMSVFILFLCQNRSCRARIVVLSRHEKNHAPGFEAQRSHHDTHTKHKIQPNTSYNEISSIKCDKNTRLQKCRSFIIPLSPSLFFFWHQVTLIIEKNGNN